jgi:hypothetical protein
MHRRFAWLAAASLSLAVSGLAVAQDNPQQDLLAAFYGPPDLTMLTYYSAGWTHLGFDDEYPNLLGDLKQSRDPNRNSFSHGWGALVTYGQFVAMLESNHAGTSSTRNRQSVELSSDALSLQVGYAPIKLPAAIGFVTAGAGIQTVGLRGYPDAPGTFDAVVVDRESGAFSISASTLVLKASAGFELAVLPPGDPWGLHAGIIAGVAYAPLEPKYRLFGGAGLLDGAPALTGRNPKLTPWSFSLSLLVGVGGGL